MEMSRVRKYYISQAFLFILVSNYIVHRQPEWLYKYYGMMLFE